MIYYISNVNLTTALNSLPGPAVGAYGPGLEGAADGDVALDGDAEGEVGAARLGDHAHLQCK